MGQIYRYARCRIVRLFAANLRVGAESCLGQCCRLASRHGSGNSAGSAGVPDAIHDEAANFVYADGHVGPLELADYTSSDPEDVIRWNPWD